ncbi:MAG: cryptochrome/photolyase family protein [Ferruginibacter sp.]
MQAVTIIFPHQLYKQHPAIADGRIIYLLEETLFFNQYNFNRQKLILHRASMKVYADFLIKKEHSVIYTDATTPMADVRKLLLHLHEKNITTIHIVAVTDNWLQKRITGTCKKYGIEIVAYPTPNFLNTLDSVKDYFDKKKTYFQTDFYIAQRKQRNILVDAGGQPEGGQWSFDTDNRLTYLKTATPPLLKFAKENKYVKEAKQYVAIHFPSNYGEDKNFIYPVDFDSAEKWLDEFLAERFTKFGAYEDAIVSNEHFLHHAVLTPSLNIGLLSPLQIINKAMAAAVTYAVPLNSLEGFIRQVMGWREYIRIVYEREGSKQRTKNYWGFTRKIPACFWKGDTGILPVDNVIKKVLKTGYSHHIERLMVMGNFMLLCEFDPNEVYRWFMEMYADAYDWVMVPNVYGMTQFADGGLMTTKPYISGSNYLLKMSDYQKGEWTETWDGLFWRFMHVQRDFFLKNPRLGMLIKTFDKMPEVKRNRHIENAENYLAKLDRLQENMG